MKHFYKKTAIFLLILVFVIVIVDWLSMTSEFRVAIAKLTGSEEYLTENNGSDEIIPYIERVRTKDQYTKLIIGDSVCGQMYRNLQVFNDDVCIIGGNAAITMAGQYILVHEFLENHEDATDIYLILVPLSLNSTFDTKFGYQYTAMPFVLTDTLQLLDENTIEKMESIYGEFFMKKPVVYAIERSAINRKLYLNELQKRVTVEEEGRISEVALQYLVKIKELCDERGVTLHLLPGPYSDSEAQAVLYEELRTEYEASVLNEYFPNYLDDAWIYPSEQFGDDLHFGGAFANQQSYNEKIKEMYEGTKLLEDLKFD